MRASRCRRGTLPPGALSFQCDGYSHSPALSLLLLRRVEGWGRRN